MTFHTPIWFSRDGCWARKSFSPRQPLLFSTSVRVCKALVKFRRLHALQILLFPLVRNGARDSKLLGRLIWPAMLVAGRPKRVSCQVKKLKTSPTDRAIT